MNALELQEERKREEQKYQAYLDSLVKPEQFAETVQACFPHNFDRLFTDKAYCSNIVYNLLCIPDPILLRDPASEFSGKGLYPDVARLNLKFEQAQQLLAAVKKIDSADYYVPDICKWKRREEESSSSENVIALFLLTAFLAVVTFWNHIPHRGDGLAGFLWGCAIVGTWFAYFSVIFLSLGMVYIQGEFAAKRKFVSLSLRDRFDILNSSTNSENKISVVERTDTLPNINMSSTASQINTSSGQTNIRVDVNQGSAWLIFKQASIRIFAHWFWSHGGWKLFLIILFIFIFMCYSRFH